MHDPRHADASPIRRAPAPPDPSVRRRPSKGTLSLYLPEPLIKAIRRRAGDENVPIAALVDRLLTRSLAATDDELREQAADPGASAVLAALDRLEAGRDARERELLEVLRGFVRLYLIHTPQVPAGERAEAVASADRREALFWQTTTATAHADTATSTG